jgi:hypothetical protein
MALHGKDGNLIAGSEIVNLQNYTLTRVTETAETSSMSDTWGTFIAGLADFTATAEGKSQIGLDTPALLGTTEAATEFSTATGGAEYTGGVIITGITETAVVDDVLSISYTFEGNDTAGLVYGASSGVSATGTDNPIHGKRIGAEWGITPTAFDDVRGWTITMTCPVSDSTVAHASNMGRTKLAGINTATATVTILTPTTDLALILPEVLTLNLTRDTTAVTGIASGQYEGNAIRTGIENGVDATGTQITVISFQYTGVVDLAVA